MTKDYEKDAVEQRVRSHIAAVQFAEDPLRKRLGPEAVAALMEGNAAVVPMRIGDTAVTYRAGLGFPLVLYYDLAYIRLDEQPEWGQP